jgi:DivIVA domain-containing protein
VVQNGAVSTTFPRARKSRKGYDIEQVEDFLEEARQAYAAEPGAPVAVTSDSIRTMGFPLTKGGYSAKQVDAALERLEDAFASRERDRAIQAQGEEAWYSDARKTAQEILTRLARPVGNRFDRISFLSKGYHRKDVDAFAERLTQYFQQGKPMSIDEVRTVVFRQQSGGYREAQVDYLLDSVVSIMLAVR